jgi:hypothetical protein
MWMGGSEKKGESSSSKRNSPTNAKQKEECLGKAKSLFETKT